MKPRKNWKRWFLETLGPYGATILFEGRDDYGQLRVVELGPYRAMYFDSSSCQGRLHHESPWIPSSEYLRSLVCGAAMVSEVNRALILGLGPGALVHTLQHLYPNAEIDTVELRQVVYQAARDYFNLPQLDLCNHLVQDATTFVRQEPNPARQYDLILVDMAMSDSVSPLLVQPGFWIHTLSHLQPKGVICANLWRGAQHRFEWIFNRLGGCLKTAPTVLRHQQLDNMVVFGSPTTLEEEDLLDFRERLSHHANLLEFDPAHLIQQIPMIQTKEEFFSLNSSLQEDWSDKELSSYSLDEQD